MFFSGSNFPYKNIREFSFKKSASVHCLDANGINKSKVFSLLDLSLKEIKKSNWSNFTKSFKVKVKASFGIIHKIVNTVNVNNSRWSHRSKDLKCYFQHMLNRNINNSLLIVEDWNFRHWICMVPLQMKDISATVKELSFSTWNFHYNMA